MKSLTRRKLFCGKCPFPIDMLRYDGCYPATENDSHLIYESISDFEAGKDYVFTVQVEKRVYPASEHGSFSVERWRSFGWSEK